MPYNWIFASSLKGFLFALEIALIIIGAVFFLSILKLSGFQEKIKVLIQGISQDRRVQVIIIAWAFTALIEGSAGFGTPVILASAILMTLGFSIIPAVTLSLVGAALHSSFGAVGTPIIFGFGAGLQQTFLAYLPEITSSIAFYNLFIGLLICLAMLIMLIFVFGKKEARKRKYVLEMIPFLMVASLLVTGPAWLLAHYLGPELPSLVGGLIGLFLLLIIVQKSWFLPKTSWDFDKIIKVDKKSGSASLFSIFQILLPYFFLALIIFISRADFFPVKAWLINFSQFSLYQIWGTDIDYSFRPLYSLGVLLFLSGGLLALFLRQSLNQIKTACRDAFIKVKSALLVLITCLIFVQIFIYSGENLNNFQSLPMVLANAAVNVSGMFWPIFAPLVGVLGSFIAGSTTVSNLWFGNFQANSALILGADPKLFLSLQSIGAALGNMLAIHNIVVALAVAGAITKTGLIIKYNILPVLIACILLGLIGFFVNFF